ncbi:hypothetical protein FF38_10584 [Lucilia cuprina]|uniref:Uncharacterized protein n=1 Tax=Lucilia cuprina TaxID=7375 RepID=A0A0L0C773_LUCCU|nr:hypothetical protein FF38_10584 [Lucilia cuprina]
MYYYATQPLQFAGCPSSPHQSCNFVQHNPRADTYDIVFHGSSFSVSPISQFGLVQEQQEIDRYPLCFSLRVPFCATRCVTLTLYKKIGGQNPPFCVALSPVGSSIIAPPRAARISTSPSSSPKRANLIWLLVAPENPDPLRPIDSEKSILEGELSPPSLILLAAMFSLDKTFTCSIPSPLSPSSCSIVEKF